MNVLRLLAFDDLEIVFAEIGDEAALLVGDGEQHVDAGDVENDAVLIGGDSAVSAFCCE